MDWGVIDRRMREKPPTALGSSALLLYRTWRQSLPGITVVVVFSCLGELFFPHPSVQNKQKRTLRKVLIRTQNYIRFELALYFMEVKYVIQNKATAFRNYSLGLCSQGQYSRWTEQLTGWGLKILVLDPLFSSCNTLNKSLHLSEIWVFSDIKWDRIGLGSYLRLSSLGNRLREKEIWVQGVYWGVCFGTSVKDAEDSWTRTRLHRVLSQSTSSRAGMALQSCAELHGGQPLGGLMSPCQVFGAALQEKLWLRTGGEQFPEKG